LNFTQAAHLLDYAQSSVSAQIRSLEDDLGTLLFQRIGRRVELTDAGRRMLEYSSQMLALEEEVRTSITGEFAIEDVIRLGAPESMMCYRLPPILRQFKEMVPKTQLLYQPMVDVEIYRQLMSGKLDFALFLQPLIHLDTMQVETLQFENLCVIAPPGHSLANQPNVQSKDLVGETIFLTENGCGYRHLFEQELSKEGHYAYTKLEFNSVEAIKRCVAEGLGVGFLPEVAVREAIACGNLIALNWEKSFSVYAQLVWHKQKWLSPTETKFVDLCKEKFALPV
jgi:DNA-binding transcriptional LysR family regulator